jgi:hypothetical protein
MFEKVEMFEIQGWVPVRRGMGERNENDVPGNMIDHILDNGMARNRAMNNLDDSNELLPFFRYFF